MIKRLILIVGLCSATAVMAQPAPPPPDAAKAQARGFFEEGIRFFNVGEFQKALDAFKQGYLVKPDPAFLFNIGQCNRMMKNFEEAAHAYRAYLREAPTAPNRADVEKYIASAEAELQRRSTAVPLAAPPTLGTSSVSPPPAAEKPTRASLVVESTPPHATVRLDDAAAAPAGKTPLHIDSIEPGAHLVFLDLPGYQQASKSFGAAAGESVRIDFTLFAELEPAKAPPPVAEEPKSHAWVAGVVVAVVLVAGAVVGGVYYAKHQETMLPPVGTP